MSQKWGRGYGAQEELKLFQKEPSAQVGGEDPSPWIPTGIMSHGHSGQAELGITNYH